MVADEVVDSILRCNISGVLCKWDLEKAYDHMNWSILCSDGLEKDGLNE